MLIHFNIFSSSKHVLSTYYLPDSSRHWDTAVNKTDKDLNNKQEATGSKWTNIIQRTHVWSKQNKGMEWLVFGWSCGLGSNSGFRVLRLCAFSVWHLQISGPGSLMSPDQCKFKSISWCWMFSTVPGAGRCSKFSCRLFEPRCERKETARCLLDKCLDYFFFQVSKLNG